MTLLKLAMLPIHHTMRKTVMGSSIIQMFKIHLMMLAVPVIHTTILKLATGSLTQARNRQLVMA